MPRVDKLHKVVPARPSLLLLLTTCSAQTARYMQIASRQGVTQKRSSGIMASTDPHSAHLTSVYRGCELQSTISPDTAPLLYCIPVLLKRSRNVSCKAPSPFVLQAKKLQQKESKPVSTHHESLTPSAGSSRLLACPQTFEAMHPAFMAIHSGACKHLDSPGHRVDLVLAWIQVSLSSRTSSGWPTPPRSYVAR